MRPGCTCEGRSGSLPHPCWHPVCSHPRSWLRPSLVISCGGSRWPLPSTWIHVPSSSAAGSKPGPRLYWRSPSTHRTYRTGATGTQPMRGCRAGLSIDSGLTPSAFPPRYLVSFLSPSFSSACRCAPFIVRIAVADPRGGAHHRKYGVPSAGETTTERGTTWKTLLYWTLPVFYCRYLYRHLGLDYQGSARYYQGTVGYLGLG